jgi:hypothetical protein
VQRGKKELPTCVPLIKADDTRECYRDPLSCVSDEVVGVAPYCDGKSLLPCSVDDKPKTLTKRYWSGGETGNPVLVPVTEPDTPTTCGGYPYPDSEGKTHCVFSGDGDGFDPAQGWECHEGSATPTTIKACSI